MDQREKLALLDPALLTPKSSLSRAALSTSGIVAGHGLSRDCSAGGRVDDHRHLSAHPLPAAIRFVVEKRQRPPTLLGRLRHDTTCSMLRYAAVWRMGGPSTKPISLWLRSAASASLTTTDGEA